MGPVDLSAEVRPARLELGHLPEPAHPLPLALVVVRLAQALGHSADLRSAPGGREGAVGGRVERRTTAEARRGSGGRAGQWEVVTDRAHA